MEQKKACYVAKGLMSLVYYSKDCSPAGPSIWTDDVSGAKIFSDKEYAMSYMSTYHPSVYYKLKDA